MSKIKTEINLSLIGFNRYFYGLDGDFPVIWVRGFKSAFQCFTLSLILVFCLLISAICIEKNETKKGLKSGTGYIE